MSEINPQAATARTNWIDAPGIHDAADSAVSLVHALDLMARGLGDERDREAFHHTIDALRGYVGKIDKLVNGGDA